MNKQQRTLAALAAIAVWSSAALNVGAAPVPIADPGFDVFYTGTTDPVDDDRFAGTVGGPQTNQPLSVASTGLAPVPAEFADVPAGWVSFGGGNGRSRLDSAFLLPTGTMALAASGDATVFAQDLGMPVAPNSTYVATIAVSDRNSGNALGVGDVTDISADVNLALLVNLGGGPDQIDLGGIKTFIPPPNGGTSLMTLIVITGSTVPVGNLFIVASTNAPGVLPYTQTYFDNATLDRTTPTIPEPTSFALLGLGGLALALTRRRALR